MGRITKQELSPDLVQEIERPDISAENVTLDSPDYTAKNVKAGLEEVKEYTDHAEQKINTHLADNVRHITAEERNTWDSHIVQTNNPHQVTKAQVGLANVENANITTIRTSSSQKLRAEVRSSAPSSPSNGDIWYDSTNHRFQGRANGAWV